MKKLTDLIFTTSQQYIFNVHQIATLCGKNKHFSGEGTDKNTAQNSPKHHFKGKIVLGRRPSHTPPLAPTIEAFWIRPCVPQNSSQIYATAFVATTRQRAHRSRAWDKLDCTFNTVD